MYDLLVQEMNLYYYYIIIKMLYNIFINYLTKNIMVVNRNERSLNSDMIFSCSGKYCKENHLFYQFFLLLSTMEARMIFFYFAVFKHNFLHFACIRKYDSHWFMFHIFYFRHF